MPTREKELKAAVEKAIRDLQTAIKIHPSHKNLLVALVLKCQDARLDLLEHRVKNLQNDRKSERGIIRGLDECIAKLESQDPA